MDYKYIHTYEWNMKDEMKDTTIQMAVHYNTIIHTQYIILNYKIVNNLSVHWGQYNWQYKTSSLYKIFHKTGV
jgi:hypothetical protein